MLLCIIYDWGDGEVSEIALVGLPKSDSFKDDVSDYSLFY